MTAEINHDRRHYLSTAVKSIAAAELVVVGAAHAQSVMNIQARAAALVHVLAVDDDPTIREAITDLSAASTSSASRPSPTGAPMRAVLANDAVDLIVLDLMLRPEDGNCAVASAA